VTAANADHEEAERHSRKTGKYKKISTTDPDATMATTGRNRRLEPSFKQHTAVDDQNGVVLDVTITTGEVNEGQVLESQVDAIAALTGDRILTVTADAGYAYGKIYGGLERRGIGSVIPAKAEPIRSPVPLRGSATMPGMTSSNVPTVEHYVRSGQSSTAGSSIPAPGTARAVRCAGSACRRVGSTRQS
jgi:Transposase DDE domain